MKVQYRPYISLKVIVYTVRTTTNVNSQLFHPISFSASTFFSPFSYFCSVKSGNAHFIAKKSYQKQRTSKKENIVVYSIKHTKTLNLT